MRLKAFFKNIVAPVGVAFKLLNGRVQVLNSRLFFRFAMLDDNLCFRVDSKRGPTTRAENLDQFARAFSHIGMVTQVWTR